MNESRPLIAVLFGGCSSEHKVSLHSARAVLDSIDLTRFRVAPIGITREGTWLLYQGSINALPSETWSDSEHAIPVVLSPEKRVHGLLFPGSAKTLRLDAVMPVLHGRNGEDGSVQGALNLAGIPIVGCGTVGSALCMDKLLSHRIAASEGISVAPNAVVTKLTRAGAIAEAAERIGYPLFVKPPREGSSLGVSRVTCHADLEAAVQNAFAFDREVMLEQEIRGIEIGCAVLEVDGKLITGVPDEIDLNGSVFNYHEKYSCETAKIIVPARISPDDQERVLSVARRLFRALGCTGFARIDLFLTHDGRIYFNEANTIPGFTKQSRFPSMFAAAGLPLDRLLTTAIEEALKL